MGLLRFILISLIILSAAACQQDVKIDPRLAPYLQQLEQDLYPVDIYRDPIGRDINYVIGKLKGPIGVCRYEKEVIGTKVTIIIDSEYFEDKLNNNGLMVILIHEIMHCSLNMGHTDDIYLMRARLNINLINTIPYTDLLEELILKKGL